MTFRVLISAPYFLPEIDRFKTFFDENNIEPVIAPVEERLEEAELLELISDIDGIVCGDDRLTARVFDAAPRLKVVSKWGTGIDSIDRAAAAARNIAVCRTPDAFTEPVADTVLGYILCFARNLPFMDTAMKQGTWKKIPGRAMNESIVGVVGVGAIGCAILRRAAPFGPRLLGYDPADIDPKTIAEVGVEMTSLEDLLARSDFVSINCDLNGSSFHLMNAETFALMQSHAIIVNAARGPVIDEKDLISALQSGAIAGAAMDVFEDEPLPVDSPLRAMDNVLIAPHNSNSSRMAWERVHLNTLNQLVSELEKRA
ncbi:MAG: dihydrofolate reductase [Rhodospirillaceae bacterium]|nr:dihydrofolate reductase [Rhodospirillaceae bacterium]